MEDYDDFDKMLIKALEEQHERERVIQEAFKAKYGCYEDQLEAQFEREQRIDFIKWVRAKVAAGLNPREYLYEVQPEEDDYEPNY